MRRESEGVTRPAQACPPRPWGPNWTPSEVIRVLEPLVGETRRARIRQVLSARISSVTVLLDSPHDPHNGAAILRSCDAFGVSTAHILIRHEPFFASGVVAKGAQRWVDVIEHRSATAALEQLKDAGFAIICTHPDGRLVPTDLGQLGRIALVLGNERDGIGEDVSEHAADTVRIPMVGFTESLNVSVSAALLLSAATADRPGDLSPEEFDRLYAQGLFRSINRAADILKASRRGDR